MLRFGRSSSTAICASVQRVTLSVRPSNTFRAVSQRRHYCQYVEDSFKVRLAVIGVGGGGCNAVNTMIENKLTDVKFVVANTDAQSLSSSAVQPADRVQLGKLLTRGLGAGANPDIGKRAAEEDIQEVLEKVGDAHMCFITAGMGGGTGTGAAPVIARALRDKKILTVGMVCLPFGFEGHRKLGQANRGIEELRASVDTLIIVHNDRLLSTIQNRGMEKFSLNDSFKMVNDLFHDGVKIVSDLIIKPSLINVDFADVRTIMEGSRWGIMSSGTAEGKNKAEIATMTALNNPLLSDTSKREATGVLVGIVGGPEMALSEFSDAMNLVRNEVSEDVNVIFGATTDESMKGQIQISLILTGANDPTLSQQPLVASNANAANVGQSSPLLNQQASASTSNNNNARAAAAASQYNEYPPRQVINNQQQPTYNNSQQSYDPYGSSNVYQVSQTHFQPPPANNNNNNSQYVQRPQQQGQFNAPNNSNNNNRGINYSQQPPQNEQAEPPKKPAHWLFGKWQ